MHRVPEMHHVSQSIAETLGPAFALAETCQHDHNTSSGVVQRF